VNDGQMVNQNDEIVKLKKIVSEIFQSCLLTK